MRELRQQMAECLADVREEAAHRRREAERLAGKVKTALNTGKGSSVSDRGDLEMAESIDRLSAKHPSLSAAVLAIDHMGPVKARFGDVAAAEVAAYSASQIRDALQDVLQVTVWRQTACVALLGGASGAGAAESQVLHEAKQHRTLTLRVGNRDVMLHVSYSRACVVPAAGRPGVSVVESMGEFLARAASEPHKR